jgi:MFS family permease
MTPAAFSRILIVGLGTLVVPLDSSVNVGFPAIVGRFGLAIPEIQWIVIAYVLTQTSLLLIFGRIADMLGYRRVFLAGCAMGALAFALSSLAETYAFLLFGRVLQGIGAGLVLSAGPALLTSMFPEEERARVLGIYTMIFGIGGALGLLVAGVLVSIYGWSVIFWYRAPLSALAFLAVLFYLPAPPHRPGGAGTERQRFDALGALLLAASIAATLFSFNRLPHAGDAPLLFGFCVLAAVLGFALFVTQQNRVAHPIINLRHFSSLDFSLINAAHSLVQLAGFSINLLGPFFLSRILNLSTPESGVMLAMSSFGIILAAPVAGRLAGRISAERICLIGMVAVAAGQAAITFGMARMSIPWMALAFLLQGIGVGAFQAAYLDVVTATLPRAERGVAGALGMLTRTFGTVSGATLLMLAFSTARDGALATGAPPPEALLTGLRVGFGCAAIIPAALVVVVLLRGGRWRR